ncbi:MAG: class I SAM-dependent methyltransferase [archaeon YNP-WB-062]|nr:class I SAM-dependent methyltransferase [Candidatus Culexarchaeum yellowstonense]
MDFLFIDGDHTYEGVKKDFEMYSPLVRGGGIIAFHDIVQHPPETGCEVSGFWNEIKLRYKYREIVED